MNETNLYNKYRPRKFSDVKQRHVVRVLQAQIEQEKLVSTYLFSGPGGTGKTTLARIMSAALMCEQRQGSEPCGVCNTCALTANDANRDVREINCADNNGVDHVRDLIAGSMRIAPSRGDFRTYILDEAHMLTAQAQNALLKVMEEPPPYVKFFACTTEPGKIISTIRTRCQHHQLTRVSTTDLLDIVSTIASAERIESDEAGLNLIVDASEGSARSSISLLQQVMLLGATEENVREVLMRAPIQLAYDVLGAIFLYKRVALFKIIDVCTREGRDLGTLMEEVAKLVMSAARHMMYKTPEDQIDSRLLIFVNGCEFKGKSFPAFTPVQVSTITKSLLEIQKNIRQNVNADLIVRASLLEIIDRFAHLRESVGG